MKDQINRRFGSISDFEIEEYLVGDLAPAGRARIEKARLESEELADYLAAREQERQAFLQQQPVLDLPAQDKSRGLWTWALVGSAAAAAILLLALLGLPGTGVSPRIPDTGIRAMGSLKATLAVKRDGRIFTYRDGVLLRKGDQLRLSVESPSGGHLTLLGKDARGQMTIYYDALPAHAGTFTVPGSLILDDSLGVEEWIVLLAEDETPAQVFSRRLSADQALKASATVIRIAKEAIP